MGKSIGRKKPIGKAGLKYGYNTLVCIVTKYHQSNPLSTIIAVTATAKACTSNALGSRSSRMLFVISKYKLFIIW